MKTAKQRLDLELMRRGLASTRQKAQGLILSGKVLVDGVRVDKAGSMVGMDAGIRLTGEEMPYVSRGGLKLKGALVRFGIEPRGFVCIDIGASTGGFTDCLLQEGASHVYTVDVGYGIIDEKLRQDGRVTVIERTNVRHMPPDALGDKADLAVVDVSFISLRLVLGPVSNMLKPGGEIVALVKPQFEVGKGKVGKGGIVRDQAERQRVMEEVMEAAKALGLTVHGDMESPIKGAKGNVEYLLYLKTPAGTANDRDAG